MTTMSSSAITSSSLYGFVREYGQWDSKTKIVGNKIMQDDIKRAIKGLDTAASKEYLCGPSTLRVTEIGDDVDVQFSFPAQTFGYNTAREAVEDFQLSLAT